MSPDADGARGDDTQIARAQTCLENEQLDEGRALCEQLLAEDPDDLAALGLLGQIELAANHDERALGCFRRAVELAPDSPAAVRDLGLALGQTGDLAGCERMLRRALALAPRYFAAHYFLSVTKRYTPGDPDLRTLERLDRDGQARDERDAMYLAFALGKALDDVGEYERSFVQLRRANALKRRSLNYDLAIDLAFLDRVRAVFDADLLARLQGAGNPTELPVLIVGMPRSGTTLVERILAAHPRVGAAGERADLAHVAGSVALLGDSRAAFPEGVADVSREYLAGLGAGYARRLERHAPGAARVTDKNLFNFAYLGMTRLIAPGAHVIHCMRDPLDTCVSCFGMDFAHVRFSFDLEELGRFYRAYRSLMDHWRTVLPAGWVLDVSYEALVAEPEPVARRIIAHLGLDWDPRCLDFTAAAGNVRTASFAQVRRPISRASVGRWRRYEPWLGPLADALEGD